ncbi:MAG: ankyrin repeat domain-containing protein, partial [Gammaproteobacteria bacterium]|nr:ankyrin repeat domain-containing protein [Gammaproteobacteria bacterium]
LTKAKQEKNTKLISILEEHLVKVENSFKEAYIKNDLASINHFLKQGKINFSKKYSFPSRHPNAPDVNMPILMKALVNRKLDIFQAFLKAGADVNIFFGEKRTGAVSSLLTLAIEAGVEYAKAVLAVPSLKVNTFNQKGNNTSYTTCALQEACQYACENKDYLPIVNLLLNVPSLDVNLMTKDEYGENTTLSKAVSSKRLDIIALLLTHKDIDVNKMSYNIRTQAYLNPIHLAVIGNNIEAFELLLSKGKNIDINLAINDKCGDTLLHIAIEKNNLEIVKRLLRMPFIDIHKKNKEGLSPLEMAYTSENPEIIRVLQDADKPVKGIGKENPKQTYVVGLLNELYRDNKNYKKSLNNLAINGSICSLLFNDIITINCENTPFNGNLFSHLMNLPPCREKFINYLMTTRIEIGPNPPKNLNHYVKAGQRAIFCLLNMVEAQCKGISLQDVQTQIVHFILANIAEDDLYKLADEAMQMPEAYKIKDLIFSDVRLKNIDKSEGMERAVRLGLKDLLIKGFVPEGHAFDPKIWGPPAILPLVQAGIAAGQDEIVLFLLKDSQMEVKSNDLSSLLSQVIERNKPEIVDALLKLVKPKHGSTLNFLSLYNRAEALQHTEIALMLKQHLITSNSNLFFSAVKQDEVNIASIQIDASTSAVNQNNPS